MTINQVITDRELADLKHRYRDNADFMQIIRSLECERAYQHAERQRLLRRIDELKSEGK